MFKKILVFLLFVNLIPIPSSAQNIDQYVSIVAPKDWVNIQQAELGSFDLAKDNDRLYRLIDKQRKVTATVDEYYYHDVTTLLSSDAVDDYGTIKASFNPDYETINLHHVRIWRASGEIVDVTEQGEMQLYRSETDREQMIYNGRLELAFLVPQLKQGDTLDFAFSIFGRNPALGPHWQQGMRHGYNKPTQILHKRLLVGEGTPVFFEAHNDAPKPTVKQLDGFVEYSWLAIDVPGQTEEKDIPVGYRSLKMTTASSVENWNEVGTFFAPLYDPIQFQSPQIEAIAETIRQANVTDAGAQLRAALGYVQSQVRYTGVQLGTGGFVPRDPSLVLARGFGDCKDMTVLLISILHALEIESTPFLVNTDVRGGLTDDIPRIAAFDHVVVRATVDGKSYILDPTRGEQLGDLENVQQGYFGKGVVISPNSVGMIDAAITQPKFYSDIEDTFDFTTDSDAILFTSRAVYSGHSADHTVNWAAKDGEAAIEKSYLDYFKGLYPSIEIAKPLTLEVDKDKAVVTLTTYYKLTDPWKQDEDAGGRVFWTSPDDLMSRLPSLPDEQRTTPLALEHPIRFRHAIRNIMDKSWGYEQETIARNTAAFDVKMVARGVPGTAIKTYTYVTKSDRILPEDLQDARAALKLFEGAKWTRMDVADPNQFWATLGMDNLTDRQIETAVSLYIALLILIQLVVVGYRPQHPSLAEMKQQILYPVSTTKFLIMSIVTMSTYTLYWFWQNWRWLRVVNDQDVSPFWRGFVFSGIWNFSLFSRIVTQNSPVGAHTARWAMPLAVAYLIISIFDRVISRSDAPLILSLICLFLSVLVVIPIQREVLRKNEINGKWVKRNSKFGWKANTALALWSPIFVLLLVGVFYS